VLDSGRFLAISASENAMPTSPVPLRLPAHPHQLEVQEFDSYALIVDLRSTAEYDDDHLPGAVSVPSGDPRSLGPQIARLAPGDSVLVYCGRGGLDSAELAAQLRRRGHATDVLPGGWDNYRRWVTASIEVLSRALSFRWIRCAPGGAAEAVLAALEAQGQQVVSLVSILAQRRLPGLSLPSDSVLSQRAFETLLVDALRRMDPCRPVWIDEPLLLGEAIGMPAPLRDALRRAAALRLDISMEERVAALRSHLGEVRLAADTAIQSPVESLIHSLESAIPAGRYPPLRTFHVLAKQGRESEALAGILTACTDSLYEELAPPKVADRETVLALRSLSSDSVWAALTNLPEPWPRSLQADPDQISP
jgi:tRNA 2-selenouridine synthase